MDHLIGQRFNLISKSEIRYVGTLHEINPEQATIALEDVYSFGTEDRAADNFIPPSQQKFDYIVFRGNDVKDIKVAEDQKEIQQPTPPSMPNDPAILNSSRPGPPPQSQGPSQAQQHNESPFPPPGYGPPPQFGTFYPPPPNQFGRGYGPPPGNFGPGPAFHPYGPPPPGYFGPSGQGYPQGPNQFPQQVPPPIGPPGQRGPVPGQHPPVQRQQAQQPKQTSELPVDTKSASKEEEKVKSPAPTSAPDDAPVAPTTQVAQPAEDVKPAEKPSKSTKGPTKRDQNRVTPAVPMTVNQRSFVPPVPAVPDTTATNGSSSKSVPTTAPTQSTMEEASRQAKEAVAAAMAKLNPQNTAPKTVTPVAPVEDLTKQVSEMSTGNTVPVRGRGGYRGSRGPRTVSGGQSRKIEIPKSDFDFESANAKFNKEDLMKEAIASGSPLGETPESNTITTEALGQSSESLARKDSIPNTQAYNKSTSFFDNISSEAKDREDTFDNRNTARTARGQEFKKNIETFGQGNVEGGGYRGRGRGRGYGGRGYRGSYGGGRGQNAGYRGRGGQNGQPAAES